MFLSVAVTNRMSMYLCFKVFRADNNHFIKILRSCQQLFENILNLLLRVGAGLSRLVLFARHYPMTLPFVLRCGRFELPSPIPYCVP